MRPDVLWIGLAALGPFLFYAYLGVQFGDPWLAFKATRVAGWWQGGFSLKPIERAVRAMRSLENLRTGQFPVVYNLNLLAGGAVPGLPRRRLPAAAAGLGRLWPADRGVRRAPAWRLGSLRASGLPGVPGLGARRWRAGWRSPESSSLSTLLLALLTILYTHWYWVA